MILAWPSAEKKVREFFSHLPARGTPEAQFLKIAADTAGGTAGENGGAEGSAGSSAGEIARGLRGGLPGDCCLSACLYSKTSCQRWRAKHGATLSIGKGREECKKPCV